MTSDPYTDPSEAPTTRPPPLAWAVGDRCVVEGRVYTITKDAGQGFYKLRGVDGQTVYRNKVEMQLVPFAAESLVQKAVTIFEEPEE